MGSFQSEFFLKIFYAGVTVPVSKLALYGIPLIVIRALWLPKNKIVPVYSQLPNELFPLVIKVAVPLITSRLAGTSTFNPVST